MSPFYCACIYLRDIDLFPRCLRCLPMPPRYRAPRYPLALMLCSRCAMLPSTCLLFCPADIARDAMRHVFCLRCLSGGGVLHSATRWRLFSRCLHALPVLHFGDFFFLYYYGAFLRRRAPVPSRKKKKKKKKIAAFRFALFAACRAAARLRAPSCAKARITAEQRSDD